MPGHIRGEMQLLWLQMFHIHPNSLCMLRSVNCLFSLVLYCLEGKKQTQILADMKKKEIWTEAFSCGFTHGFLGKAFFFAHNMNDCVRSCLVFVS